MNTPVYLSYPPSFPLYSSPVISVQTPLPLSSFLALVFLLPAPEEHTSCVLLGICCTPVRLHADILSSLTSSSQGTGWCWWGGGGGWRERERLSPLFFIATRMPPLPNWLRPSLACVDFVVVVLFVMSRPSPKRVHAFSVRLSSFLWRDRALVSYPGQECFSALFSTPSRLFDRLFLWLPVSQETDGE